MGIFDSLERSTEAKKVCSTHAYEIYRKNIKRKNDVSYLKDLNVIDLQGCNRIKKRKNPDLVNLWAKIEMQKLIDYFNGDTINPYCLEDSSSMVPIKDLECFYYLPDSARLHSLLDIKWIKSLKINKVEFQDLFLCTFEIFDYEAECYKPYVEFLVKDDQNNYTQIGYGFDLSDDGIIELFIDHFNYHVYLTTKGVIEFPLTNEKVRLSVYDIITSEDIKKMFEDEANLEEE